MKSPLMPSYFFAHGAPSIALEQNAYTDMLKAFSTTIPQPRAIVLFSAHWEHPIQSISAAEGNYDTIYDFSGFQDELYQMIYPARGDVSIRQQIQSLFAAHDIPCVLDPHRGLDHGAWAVLKLLYPQADIPVIALSVNRHLTNEQQYRIGQALSKLKEQDVLIIGSGGTVHNLRRVNWRAEQVEDWALSFDTWLEEKLVRWDLPALFQYHTEAPYAKEAVPTNEHFVPLFLAMGAGDNQRKATLLHRSYQYGTLSLSCWQFA
jgi:4,5-DOPA dioxygenase extradiol